MKSMTGFGRAEGHIGNSRITIEIKSVNHRYFDTRFRMPPFLVPYEIQLTEKLKTRFQRGSFDISIRHKLVESSAEQFVGTRYVLDEIALASLMGCYEKLHEKYKTPKTPPPEVIPLFNKIILPVEENQNIDTLYTGIEKLFESAAADVGTLRQKEGAKLRTILTDSLDKLDHIASDLERVAPEQPQKIGEKLKKKLERWKLDPPPDTQRIELEIAMYAERSDFTEEIDRLKTHLSAFRQLIGETGALGRQLDFLTQELHRELNTLGAKAATIETGRFALAGKGEVEKLRQQIQNVE